MTCKRRCQLSVGVCPRGFVACLAFALVVSVGFAELLPAAEAAREKPKQVRPPVELGGHELVTGDGVQLSATFFPGPEDKETVPVILLHMWKGDRREYAGLAPYLQQQGYAVLVPDLRGHGGSTEFFGTGRKLDGAKMAKDHFYLMPYKDMETLRRFLVNKNDEGELNLNKLCIVGAEMGAAVAAYYTFYDWTTPRREADRAAASQDVKGLVLISPDWDFKGLPMSKPLSNPLVRSQVSVMIVVGKESSSAAADARRVYNLLDRFHADYDAEDADKRDLFFGQLPTKLQGTKMLGVSGLNLERAIARFIELRLVNQEYPWYQRGSGK